ncbi:MAG: hypothetical protein EA358_00220 [Flavobacteriales bacterium]|nr:MAG: hypothetical protein EA358_00220 [Flavobacteriales bacterium]
MKSNKILIAHPKTNKELKALKAFMEALKIKFEMAKESPYDPEFIEKVLESRQQVREGKVTRLKKEDLKEFLGL